MGSGLTTTDLARCRVLFAAVSLMMLWDRHWPAAYPDSVFSPPPGPFQLLDGFLPEPVAIGLEIVLAVAFGCLLFGVRVAAASVTVTVVTIVLAGFTYSLGKVNHTILLEVAPVLLLAAGWGRPAGRATTEWALRLLAFILGLAMLSAGLMKGLGGWFDPSVHSVWGIAIESHYQQGNELPLSGLLMQVEAPWVWEALDWTTVLMECSIVLLAFAPWRWFRVGLAVLALFHLGVLLSLGIGFSSSIMVYAAFVPWSRLQLPGWVRLPSRHRTLWAVGVGVGAWSLTAAVGNLTWLVDPGLLVVGAAVAVWYLTRPAVAVVQRRRNAVGIAL